MEVVNVVSGLENDVQYNISVSISDLPEYLGNVVTVDLRN